MTGPSEPSPALARELKAQSALEYLTTYGWAILVLVVVIGVLFSLGFINPRSPISPSCVFSSDLNCKAFALNTTGHYALDLGQGTGHTIRVTHIRCTQETNATLNTSDLLATPVMIGNGEHAFITNGTQTCISTDTGVTKTATGFAGNAYKGKFYVRYTDIETNFQHTSIGDVVIKYEDALMTTPTP